ncbi:histidine kinase [Cronbergia sp. UHCC 0137]|uniref:histidine kinase n=1 Tax=Cronbergia sp. UHCC 0137 TaxID=3110239 RepID=UPI002B208528|nr:histidine kinase [Cronbergia sp. UHCC 0137]MEA5618749.1 histidine kinase [Cronbergia sp. UHCC 0137]
MVIGVRKRAISVFAHRRDIEQALHELKNTGFAMERVSVIARDSDRKDDIGETKVQEKVGNKADDGATVGAISGGTLGGLTGLLVGLGTLALPGIGPIMLAGATATTLATTIAGAGIGAAAGGLIGSLIGLGIPEERAKVYHERVERGDYLVIIEGTDAEIANAEAVFHRWGVEEFEIYDHLDHEKETVDITHRDVTHSRNAIGYFSSLQDAEAAINDLRNVGFPLHQISLTHNKYLDRNALAGIKTSDRFEESNTLGLRDDQTRFYQKRIQNGDYIVTVKGSEVEIHRATEILRQHGIQQWQIYEPNGHQNISSQTRKRSIGVFSHRREAEAALQELHNAGFPMNQVSLIAKNANNTNIDRDLNQGNKTGEPIKTGAATGGAVGGLGGLLVGLGTLAIPGVGPVMAGGAVATALATTLTGGAVGAAIGGIAGALVDLGIPEDRARIYSDRFQQGDYLIMVDGTEAQILQAQTILNRQGIQDFSVFNSRDMDEHQPLEPVKHTDTISANYPGESPVVVIDHRQPERI